MPELPPPDYSRNAEAIALAGLKVLRDGLANIAIDVGSRDRGPMGLPGERGRDGRPGRDGRDGRPGRNAVLIIDSGAGVKALARSDPERVAELMLTGAPAELRSDPTVLPWLAGIYREHPQLIELLVDEGAEAYGRALVAAVRAEARR